MTYTAVGDFKYGMDRRRMRVSGVPGTLWTLENGVITRGGDIERTKKFVPTYSLPEGTFGTFSLRNQKYVFGSGTTPVGMPSGVRYMQLAHPSGADMTRVLDSKAYDGKVYAVASFSDGSVYHYFDGTRITDWDAIADGGSDFETVADRLALLADVDPTVLATRYGVVVELVATTPGVGFTLTATATDNGGASTPIATAVTTQANVAASAEVRAAGTIVISGGSAEPSVNKISSVKADGNELLFASVDWRVDNSETANALALEINGNGLGYTASVMGATVSIQAPVGAGASANGDTLTATVLGDVTAIVGAFSGGADAVEPVAQIVTVTIGAGTFDAADAWTITLNGTPYKTTGRASATGTSLYIKKRRVYSTVGSLIRYCKLNDPTDWSDPAVSSGAGFINVSNDADGAESLVGMADYNELTAVFAKNVIVTYQLYADAETNTIAQIIGNTGTSAPRSVVAYGANDVFYLDRTGVRSLRARETYNAAYASDVGSAFDTYIQEVIQATSEDVVSRSCAVIEALDGRYFLAIGDKVVILSQFPASKITAWSYATMPGPVTDMCKVGTSIYVRVADEIYVYGGLTGTVWPDEDESVVTIETPFISAKDPAGMKMLEGFDMAAENAWRVRVHPDPDTPEAFIDAGTIQNTTYHLTDIIVPGRSTHFALSFQCRAAGKATLSSIALHHESE